jgi:protein gp37
MSESTPIEWTDATWNPVTGCSKVSPGCDNCYAERFAERFRGVPGHPYEQGFDLRLWYNRLNKPLEWKRSKLVFVNSMSDLFNKDVPQEFIAAVFDVMEQANWHTFQVLTKRSSRLRNFINERFNNRVAPQHIWLGTSIEDRAALVRLDHIRETRASIRFLSIEPLLEGLGQVNLKDIHWVIVGGESGPNSRAMRLEWVQEIRDQCIEAGVPFFFKQWGGLRPKSGGNSLEGRTWLQYPHVAATCLA